MKFSTTFYVKLPNDPTSMYQSEILSFLKNAKTQGWISQSEFVFLYCQQTIKPVFILFLRSIKD